VDLASLILSGVTSSEFVLKALDHRPARWALVASSVGLVSISLIWDGRRAGGIAGALWVLGFVAFVWMLACPPGARFRAGYAASAFMGSWNSAARSWGRSRRWR
jgi:hypothetical protein